MINNDAGYIVVPRERIDYKTSFEKIEQLTAWYIADQSKHSSSNLEIEIKIGYTLKWKDQVSKDLKDFLYSLSYRGFLIVGAGSEKINSQKFFGFRDFMEEKFRFTKESISKQMFLDVKGFFEKEATLYPGKIKEGKSEFSVDFAMADESRVTYDLVEGAWKRLKKKEKSSIDILHKGLPYRISYAFEEPMEFKEADFVKMNVSNIRIKDRKRYQLEYMEYNLTEVVSFAQTGNNLEELKTTFLKSSKKGEVALQKYAEMHLKMQEEYEMEVEIIDKTPFVRNLGRMEFSGYMKRFMRNSEALFFIPKIFHEQISMQHCGNDVCKMPIIGQYFAEYYLEKDKKKDQND